ncbi:rhamnulose-1-phosphate aldolase [Coprobacter tertius]|uniref:Rhamnulose-1-phosphate aldolase n=1 Tax=Coprobacter tertius TaxID=2944915 RepID=A0ABT1MKG5_9BACT|nr:rhamnulose-1-phosphate aldolase [Coprobacter tertius]MCP9613115.1 rhamnulose-1-phosphate aldolase [Coprobacter tertius]
MILHRNDKLKNQLDEIAEIASYLWTKGWAERNAGNISIDISELISSEDKKLPPLKSYALPRSLPELGNHFFYVTGTGRRMRDVAKDPLSAGSVIRISSDGSTYDIIGEKEIKPTSELPSHLCIHRTFITKGTKNRLVLHTHPTELTALSHIKEFRSEENLNKVLWAMHPETFIVVPHGLGFIPYEVPGTLALADMTLKGLENHDFVVWEKHGVLGVGENLADTFDLIDTLNKSAQLYLQVRMSRYEPEGLTDEQIKGLIEPFDIKL